MKKKIISIINWHKYQARNDKELPWLKLWGSLFDKPWFQEISDSQKYFTIVLLDLARKTNNRIGDLHLKSRYLSGNYGLNMSQDAIFKSCNLLYSNDFLSDKASDLQDKIRVDKIREEGSPSKSSFVKPSLDACVDFFLTENSTKIEGEKFFYHFESNGWKVGGKTAMKDWKASAKGWIRRNFGGNNNGVDKQENRKPIITTETLRELESQRHPEEGQIRFKSRQPKEQPN